MSSSGWMIDCDSVSDINLRDPEVTRVGAYLHVVRNIRRLLLRGLLLVAHDLPDIRVGLGHALLDSFEW